MGRSRSTRKRRAAKDRRRAGQAGGGSRPKARGGGPTDDDTMLVAAMHAWERDPASCAALLDQLASLAAAGAPVLARARRRIDQLLVSLWEHGWTPVDVVHITSRRLTAPHEHLVRDAVVADGRRRALGGAPPHDRWQAQLDLLSDMRMQDGVGTSASDVRVMVRVLALLSRLPAIPFVMPGPGQAPVSDAVTTARMDQRMLARVRGLLAKAESTEFGEEAEALTAKAQELIARHAIADALLHTSDDTGAPSVRRVPVDSPYADAKVALVSVIADANRCQAVHSPDLGWVTLVGYDGDLDAVELLGTSLLAQAANAMARQGPRRQRDGRSTTRSFRRAFLFGFAVRIGERLRAAAEGEVLATGAARARLLPVLATRSDRVHDAVTATFPQLERRTTQISNPTGWSAGKAAADLADLAARTGGLDR